MDRPDILVAGDVLVDFLPSEPGPPSDDVSYTPRLGGSSANVAIALETLGVPPLFWTRFATDGFGRFLRAQFEERAIPDEYLITDDGAKTTLAVVSHDADGERSFEFYRERGADTRLSKGTVPDETLNAVSWVHTTGVTMGVEPSRTATQDLQRRASDSTTVSLDPNWRPGLWESREDFAETIRGALGNVDVLVASEEDLDAAGFDAGEPAPLAEAVADQGPHTVVITLGEEGALCFGTPDSPVPGTATHQGYDVAAVDTTGAGDAFLAGIIASLAYGVADPERMLALSNAVGAVATTQPGAVAALTSLAEIRQFHDDIPWEE